MAITVATRKSKKYGPSIFYNMKTTNAFIGLL